METVEALRKVIGKNKVVMMRSTFMLDESWYPANHDYTKTKDWVVIVYDEKDHKNVPDPRTADGKDKEKVKTARTEMKKAKKDWYWFDNFLEADIKYRELAKRECDIIVLEYAKELFK